MSLNLKFDHHFFDSFFLTYFWLIFWLMYDSPFFNAILARSPRPIRYKPIRRLFNHLARHPTGWNVRLGRRLLRRLLACFRFPPYHHSIKPLRKAKTNFITKNYTTAQPNENKQKTIKKHQKTRNNNQIVVLLSIWSELQSLLESVYLNNTRIQYSQGGHPQSIQTQK